MLVALLVCLIPTTIGALLSAIGIAGMDRLVQRNVLACAAARSRRPGDCDTLLLDKTGTITLGNRQATDVRPRPGRRRREELADAAQLSCLADETPEGRSIVVLAKERLRPRASATSTAPTFVPFTAQTRMSGVDLDGRAVRKGAADAIGALGRRRAAARSRPSSQASSTAIATTGGTPLVVAEGRPRARASSTSRTSSRTACASASTSCARWASAR